MQTSFIRVHGAPSERARAKRDKAEVYTEYVLSVPWLSIGFGVNDNLLVIADFLYSAAQNTDRKSADQT